MEELHAGTGQIQAPPHPESSLTCSIVRFLKGPLYASIELAKKRGVYKGRPTMLSAHVVASLVKRLDAGEKASELAREFGISWMTLHRYRTKAAGVEG